MEPKDIFRKGSTEILYFLMHITVHWTSLLSNSEMPLIHDKQFHRQWDSQDWIGWQPNFWLLPKFSFNEWYLPSWSPILLNKIIFQVSKKHFVCITKLLFCFIKEYCSFNSIPILCSHVFFILCILTYCFYFTSGFPTNPMHKSHDDSKWLDIFQSPFLFWPKKRDGK